LSLAAEALHLCRLSAGDRAGGRLSRGVRAPQVR